MDHRQATVEPAARVGASLRGRPLFIARAAWVATATLILTLLFVAVPVQFEYLKTPCSGCDWAPITPEGVRELGEFGLSAEFYATYMVAVQTGYAILSSAVAAAIFWRGSGDRMALLAAFTLLAWGATFPDTLFVLEDLRPAWELPVGVVDLLSLVAFVVFFYAFPDGRFVPRWTRWMAVVWGLIFFTTSFFPDLPFGVSSWPVALQLALLVVWMGSLAFAQIHRYRQVSGPVERQQTKWVVFGFVAAIVGFLMLVLIGTLFPSPGTMVGLAGTTSIHLFMLLIPLSIAFAIRRYKLWDIDLIINRAIAYGALTSVVIGVYVLVVGGLGVVLQARGNMLISLLATGIVAVLFAPLRDRLQLAVNRLMYGERDDPYAVLSRLGQRLEATLEPGVVLPAVAETVATALKLPYAAIELREHDGFTLAASHGPPTPSTVTIPLVHQHETVGRLLLAPRAGEGSLSPADRRLLDDLARQAGVAVHAVRLTADLQRARERLVTTREEERRRLRRDLHDGLGPQLSSQALTIDAVREILRQDPDAAETLLLDLKAQSRDAVADIRRLVYALRPPALDDLGLVGAMRASASEYVQNGLRVSVEAPGDLPPLPAAVEVAAYRIVQEALTNVARHAGASRCIIRLVLEDTRTLRLEVEDDGRGIGEDRGSGVGLHSMRERARELGGECVVEMPPAGGTRVRAVLPIPDPADPNQENT